MRPVAATLRGAIYVYRVLLSPILGRQCRYLPTCSQYADEAVKRYGAWTGSWLTLARILRCNPFGAAGYDPVPDLPPEAGRRPWRHARWTARHMDPATRIDRSA
ncbi:membrane protein insertion efficiency factor YidD [Acuticoccus sediminis]|uniref:Putative membrane protein insertion efficiency factor n=1 Tax=Acuticoccus sediminis TaxID=2184697 RepID=A0A8B2NT05_9HYPH|nr:membrane protein insertion efficiency factor YidD [Acuticoccus sediminis]RAH98723.1 membrane protein insertion efficiency factor YidD [Acuticoccus sediminis]